jgi:hypothetical protein
MSIATKKHVDPGLFPPAKQSRDDKQLRSDRWTAVVVVAVMLALMAVIIWLASMTGGTVPDGFEYWDMMP